MACFRHTCENNKIYILIGNEKLECQNKGQEVSPSKSSGFEGSVICPDAAEYC
jgi:hypothetical protein